jgi:hypothetical protein
MGLDEDRLGPREPSRPRRVGYFGLNGPQVVQLAEGAEDLIGIGRFEGVGRGEMGSEEVGRGHREGSGPGGRNEKLTRKSRFEEAN